MSAEAEPVRSFACERCGFAVWHQIADLGSAVVGLYDDARFPGRCLVVLREHFEHLHDLDEASLARMMSIATKVGRAVQKVVDADRINYAVLGNTEPHVHVHVIPRLHRIDPVPDRPPWEHPEPVTPLAAADRTTIAQELSELLGA